MSLGTTGETAQRRDTAFFLEAGRNHERSAVSENGQNVENSDETGEPAEPRYFHVAPGMTPTTKIPRNRRTKGPASFLVNEGSPRQSEKEPYCYGCLDKWAMRLKVSEEGMHEECRRILTEIFSRPIQITEENW